MPASSATERGWAKARPAAFEVPARHRTADAVEIAGDLACDIAAIVIVEPGMGEMIERCGERWLLEGRAGIGRATIDQECLRKAGDVPQFGEFLGR